MKYDKLFINGKIFTALSEDDFICAMAVRDGKIAWTGKSTDAQAPFFTAIASQSEEVLDLSGKCVLPGFVDSHMHAIMLANCSKQISVLPPLIHSIDELIVKIQETRAQQDVFLWIEGWGYDEGKLTEGRAPNRWDLDRGCSDAPVMILRTCGHTCVVNSYLLAKAGITKDTPDPDGGKIGRSEDGEPNGILYENARNLITALQTPLTISQIGDHLADLGKLLVSQGVTTGADMGEFIDYDYQEVYQDAIKKGFPLRVAGYYMWDAIKNRPDFSISESDMDPSHQFRVAGIKLIGDGSVSGKTAWYSQPYLLEQEDGTPEYGMPVCTESDIEDALAFAKSCGCQLSVHCMGDQAIERAVAHTYRSKPWTNAGIPSVRLEHVAFPTKEAIQRASAAGIAWVTQPVFLYAEIESYLKNLGEERTKEQYPIQDMLDAGIHLAFSSDAPATAWAFPSDPFIGLKAAVTRKSWNGTDCGARHRVSIGTAICLYTARSAPMLGFTEVGMLQEGFAADFIILDQDIFTVEASRIDQVKVVETWIGANCVYKRK